MKYQLFLGHPIRNLNSNSKTDTPAPSKRRFWRFIKTKATGEVVGTEEQAQIAIDFT